MVDTDGGAGWDMDAIDGFARGRDNAGEGTSHGGVETKGFANDGFEVFEVVSGGDCDLFFGGEGGANFVDEFQVGGWVGEDVVRYSGKGGRA